MAYTTIDDPTQYFNTVLWTGDGTDDRNITGVGFQPDMVWEKKRNEAGSHRIADSVRGATNVLFPDLTNAEASRPNEFQAFISDGFQIGSDSNFNGSSNTHVGWSWLAGTSFSNDASATGVGSIDSSGSVNETAGFSICTYTGVSSAGTIKHGLSTVPSMIIWKNRSASNGWITYHHKNTSAPETDYLELHSTNGTNDLNTIMNDTAPTSSVFSIGTEGAVGGSNTNNFVTYVFSERKGYSKFGSYTGNGNANGTFVYTGFKPAWVMFKGSSFSGENWDMYDNKRETFNVMDSTLKADSNGAESSNSLFNVDFLSNGIKLRNGHTGTNQSGSTYIYMAFAESPFVNSNGVPCNAR